MDFHLGRDTTRLILVPVYFSFFRCNLGPAATATPPVFTEKKLEQFNPPLYAPRKKTRFVGLKKINISVLHVFCSVVLPIGGLESTSVLRETELLRDVLRLSCRAAERDLMQTASKGHWTDG